MIIAGNREKRRLARPIVPTLVANHVPVRRVDDLLFSSGQTTSCDRRVLPEVEMGPVLPVEEGQEAARRPILNCLAGLEQALESLVSVGQVIKQIGFITPAGGFPDLPSLMNGASFVLAQIYSEGGRPDRIGRRLAELFSGKPVGVEPIVSMNPAA